MKKLEVSEHWALCYTDRFFGWMPYCRLHVNPEMIFMETCSCEVPTDMWKKCLFMDRLEKFIT